MLLYLASLAGTIALQSFSVLNPQLRLLVNGSTLLMAAVGLALFGLIYAGMRKEKQKEGGEKEEEEPVFDKGAYLSFASTHDLTRRETEIGLLVLQGYTNLRIAESLYIAETTVKKHLTHIYEKTGVASRGEFRQVLQEAMKSAAEA